ncbi:MAG: helicase HerA-like domain-containing protein [Candidatus Woesearchaeota archaeon]
MAIIGYSKEKPFDYPIDNLKKHLFAFGSSGSGKTVFSKVIIEEAALAGIPSILVDPQGDLASLIQPAEDDKEEVRQYKENVRVTIFTPISSKGIPICINPLRFSETSDPEEIVPVLNEIATSLAKLLGYSLMNDKGKAAASILYTILKSHYDKQDDIGTFKRLAEILEQKEILEQVKELIKDKKDIEELVRKVRFLTVGQKELLFQFGTPVDIEELFGRKRDKTQISIIYLNTLTNQEEKEFFLTILATQLYQWMLSNPSDKLQGLFYIDEVAPYMPAGSEKPMPKPILLLLLKQARKYGIGIIIATQNPGDIDYKAFAQFGTWAIGRLTTKQDQKKIENALKSISNEDISNRLPKLKAGNFLLFSPDVVDKITHIKVRWLYTKHATIPDTQLKALITKEDRDYFSAQETKTTKTEDALDFSHEKPPETAQEQPKQETIQDSPQEQPKQEAKETQTIPKGNDTADEESVKHFPLLIDDRKLTELIELHRKRTYLIGPKEKLGSYNLELIPFYALTVVQRKSAFMSKGINIFKVLMNAENGTICRTNRWECNTEFKRLIDLTSNEIIILRHLADRATNVSVDSITLKLKFKKQAITRALNNLRKKKLVSAIKEGTHNMWFAIVDLNNLAFNVRDLNSQVETNNRPLGAKERKAKVTIKQCETLFQAWFKADVTEHELIYLPVYTINFLSPKGTRTIHVNGYTTKLINT